MRSDASFSSCGIYRWRLTRFLNNSKKELIFVGLNPSMANSSENDPTIRRIVGFADLWGYGSLTVINLFAKISKKPKILKYCHDPIGPRNDFEINKNLRHWSNNHLCDLWIGWGVNGKLMNRNNQVLKKIRDYDSKTPYVIGLTKEGHPCHPLYISKQSKLIHYYQN